MRYALLQNLRFEFSRQNFSQRPKYLLQSVGLLFTLLRTLIPMLEHKTVLSFQVKRNGNQTGNRLRFLSLYSEVNLKLNTHATDLEHRSQHQKHLFRYLMTQSSRHWMWGCFWMIYIFIPTMQYYCSVCYLYVYEMHSRDITLLIVLLWFNIMDYSNLFQYFMVPTLVVNSKFFRVLVC